MWKHISWVLETAQNSSSTSCHVWLCSANSTFFLGCIWQTVMVSSQPLWAPCLLMEGCFLLTQSVPLCSLSRFKDQLPPDKFLIISTRLPLTNQPPNLPGLLSESLLLLVLIPLFSALHSKVPESVCVSEQFFVNYWNLCWLVFCIVTQLKCPHCFLPF